MHAIRGGVKRIAEYASRLTLRGHGVFVLSPDREVPEWLFSYRNTYKLVNIDKYKNFKTDVVIATGGRAGRRMGRMVRSKVKVYSVVMLESLNKPTEKHGEIIDRDRFLRDPYKQNWVYYANSTWLKEKVETDFGQKCHLVLAPSNERIQPVPTDLKPKGKLWVLGYGGNADWKGGHRTAEAVTIAKRTLPNLEMIHYSQRSVPRSRVLVKHWGNPKQELLPQIYSAADLFCHSSRFEGFANCCMESISCGTPVVSYNTPGIEDIVIHRQTGIIVDKFDTRHMARAIVRTLQDRDLYEKMKVRCIEKAREFSWDKALLTLEEIFAEALNR
jgi:hypothetical protein